MGAQATQAPPKSAPVSIYLARIFCQNVNKTEYKLYKW